MPPAVEPAWDLPRLRVQFGLEFDTRFLQVDDKVAEFFDVKFCPYQPLDQDPVFAAVSKKHIVICRLSSSTEEANPCEILQVIRDEDTEAVNYCCTWCKDGEASRPYLAVAGQDAKIKIYDVTNGTLITCLVGHGGDINDLTTSPVDAKTIASASDDTTVRIWSLDPVHAGQPCLAVLGGEGHSWNLLSVAFHDCGRYLLSAGHDQVINLWTIPDLATSHIRVPVEIHYPHFSTSEIHSGIVDCLAFYDDNILSRACHDDLIVMWRIEGFSSSDPPPLPEDAPTTYNPSRLTRSAFAPPYTSGQPRQFTRIMSFHTPGCGPQFFMRFKLFFVPSAHPVLAFCNAAGKIFFWDLARLVGYHEYKRALLEADKAATSTAKFVGDKAASTGDATEEGTAGIVVPARPSWLAPIQKRGPRGGGGGDAISRIRGAVVPSSGYGSDKESVNSDNPRRGRESSSVAGGEGAGGEETDPKAEQKAAAVTASNSLLAAYNQETIASWEDKYNVENPHEPLKAHRVETVGSGSFIGRQVAWSPGGEWCVVVGSSNCALVLQRWRDGAPGR